MMAEVCDASLNGPVSESESERQRARNGASDSERDFSREPATKLTIVSKRAKFRTASDFFLFTMLQRQSADYVITYTS